MTEIKTFEDKDIILGNRYRKWSKAILLIAVIYFIWTVFVIISIYFLEMGYRWALLSIVEWIYLGCFLIGFFIALELIFFIHYRSAKKIRWEEEKPQPLFYKGKRLHIYTHPEGSKGGIFSKTHVKIDENNILNLRTQMILPDGLWGKK